MSGERRQSQAERERVACDTCGHPRYFHGRAGHRGCGHGHAQLDLLATESKACTCRGFVEREREPGDD